MRVFLDDTRPAPPGFVLVKSASDAIDLLKTDRVSFLSLDHDLGEEKSGYDVINWLEEQVVAGILDVPILTVHSANSPGRENINRAIAAINRRSEDQPFPAWGFLKQSAANYFQTLGLRLIERTSGSYPGLFLVGGRPDVCIEIKGSRTGERANLTIGLGRIADRLEVVKYRYGLIGPDLSSLVDQLDSVKGWAECTLFTLVVRRKRGRLGTEIGIFKTLTGGYIMPNVLGIES